MIYQVRLNIDSGQARMTGKKNVCIMNDVSNSHPRHVEYQVGINQVNSLPAQTGGQARMMEGEKCLYHE